MKHFQTVSFNPKLCRNQLEEFRKLLCRTKPLREREDILPFFRKNLQLAALIGSLNPRNSRYDRIATEFHLFGDHVCDLAVGDSVSHHYCFIEFEDASTSSVFKKANGRGRQEWAPRFNCGFSQIIDWFCVLEDQKRTGLHKSKFGVDVIQFVGVLIIGRTNHLSDDCIERLQWRSENVRIGSRQVHCLTFDQLFETLSLKLDVFAVR